ncbi:MAG: cytidine deaminase [bacterium]
MSRTGVTMVMQARLVKAALQAAQASYSPYSRFPVGAALLVDGGKVYAGCNVENASYGLTLCAERVAVLKAVSEGKRKFRALAVAGGRNRAVRPCGACLQVLAEFCDPALTIFLTSLDKPGKVETVTLATLLPQVFRKEDVRRQKTGEGIQE